MKISYNNYKHKISAPTWNDKFELPDGPYSISEIQDYFEYIIKQHETFVDFSIGHEDIYILTKLKTELHLKLKQDTI